jgi:hypothetical protein
MRLRLPAERVLKRSCRPGARGARIVAAGLGLIGGVWAVPSAAWLVQLGSGPGGVASTVAVDDAGDVIAAGGLDGPFAVVKLAGASGTELWRRTIPGAIGSGSAAKTIVDADGDVIAAGWLSNGSLPGASDFAVVKLNGATSAELWHQEISGTGTPDLPLIVDDLARDVAVDPNGDVLAVGRLYNAPPLGFDFTVIKLAGTTGAELWRRELGGSDSDVAVRVIVDGTGDLFATGIRDGLLSVVRLAGATGAELWTAQLGDVFTTPEATVDAAGDVIAGGVAIFQGFVVVKFAGGTGAQLWRGEAAAGGTYTFPNHLLHALAVDPAGNVIAAGLLDVRPPVRDFAVAKFDGGSGALLWKFVPGPLYGFDTSGEASDVGVDAAGDVTVVGWLPLRAPSGPKSHFVVMKLAGGDGRPLWRQEINVGALSDRAQALVLAGGGVVAAGQLDSTFAVARLGGLDGAIGPVAGNRLQVEDHATDASRRKVVGRLKDANLVTPPVGSPGDPTLGGATLKLVNPTTSESATIILPGGSRWRAAGNPPGSRGYSYADPGGMAGPCTKVRATPHKVLQVACSGAFGSIPFTLDEPSQGSLVLSMRLGSADPQCATFGGTVLEDAGTSNPGPGGSFRATTAPRVFGSCP